MKRAAIIMSVLVLCGGTVFAQSQLDAYKYSQTDLTGTARYLSMGGAFGALGGDISSIKTNPAGLAIYRSSEVVTTVSVSSVESKTNWLGTKLDNTRTKMGFDNIAYVSYYPTGDDEGIVSWNIGLSYNRVKNYSRNYTMSAGGSMHTSLSDYVAERAYGTSYGSFEGSSAYDTQGDWLSVLGYNAGYIDAYQSNSSMYYSSFGDYNTSGEWENYLLEKGELKVAERGSVDLYNVGFGVNISDRVMLGAAVAVWDLNYRYSSMYDETFTNGNDLYLDNYLKTDGTGYSFNLGAIVRPADCLRLGVAYNSPTWYDMTDHYYAQGGSYLTYQANNMTVERELNASSPDNAYTDYKYRAPDKWIFSAAAILGTTALISVDYELTNYKNMRMRDYDGNDNIYTNADIDDNFKVGNTIRVGAEVKVVPQFSVRAGFSYSDSPMKDRLKEGLVEVATVGTLPHYTIEKSLTNYTVGLGYRFTPNFYMDLACVFRIYKEDAYAFSSMFDSNGDTLIEAQPATLKTNTTRVALTLGYKF